MNLKSEIEKAETEVRRLENCLAKAKFQLEFLRSQNFQNHPSFQNVTGLTPIPKPRIARKPSNLSKNSIISKPQLRSTTPSADSGGGGSEPLSSENSPNFNKISRHDSQRLVRLKNIETDSDEVEEDDSRTGEKFYSEIICVNPPPKI